MKISNLIFLTILLLLLSVPTSSFAWKRDGHAVVGKIAIDLVDQETRDWLTDILGDTSAETLRFACNWPDIVREQEQYTLTLPFHYVNLPRGASKYHPERDCHDGRCITEKIKYFAARLDMQTLANSERKKAFNWLCHLTGDIHQPLHSGFADDRGGNSVSVKYHGTTMPLHTLWDEGIIRRQHSDWQQLSQALLQPAMLLPRNSSWCLTEVDEWTNESHQIVLGDNVYPPKGKSKISRRFEQQADHIIQTRLSLAGSRLATILSAIGTGQVNQACTQN